MNVKTMSELKSCSSIPPTLLNANRVDSETSPVNSTALAAAPCVQGLLSTHIENATSRVAGASTSADSLDILAGSGMARNGTTQSQLSGITPPSPQRPIEALPRDYTLPPMAAVSSTLWVNDLEKQRWQDAFDTFWQSSAADCGVPHTPLLAGLGEAAIREHQPETLLWLIEQIKLPITQPQDDDEQEPRRAHPLRDIVKNLAIWPTVESVPIWFDVFNCIADIDDSSSFYNAYDAAQDIEISLRNILAELPHLDDAVKREEFLCRASRIVSKQLSSNDDSASREKALKHIDRTRQSGFVPKEFKSPAVRQTLPEPNQELTDPDTIRQFAHNAYTGHYAERGQLEQLKKHIETTFVAALQCKDQNLIDDLTKEMFAELDDPMIIRTALDVTRKLVRTASNQMTSQAFFNAVLENLLADQPTGTIKRYPGDLLSSLAHIWPESRHESIVAAQQVLPFLNCSAESKPGAMDVWLVLAKQNLLQPLLQLKKQ